MNPAHLRNPLTCRITRVASVWGYAPAIAGFCAQNQVARQRPASFSLAEYTANTSCPNGFYNDGTVVGSL